MIVHDVIQGTPEWIALRLGNITGSKVATFCTPKGVLSQSRDKSGPSAKSIDYLAELTAERKLGHPLEEHERTTSFMERGSALEDEAIRWYEMRKRCDVRRIGGMTNDAGDVWVSPDGLVTEDGGCEVKVLSAKNHIRCSRQQSFDAKYTCQCQIAMMIGDYKWWDQVLYNPVCTSRIFRMVRDDKMIAAMAESIETFKVFLSDWCETEDVPSDWRDRIIVQPPDVDDNYLCEINPEDKPGWDMAVAAHARKTQEQAQVAFEAGAQVQ